MLEDLIGRRGVRHAIIGFENGSRTLRWIGAAGKAADDGTPMRKETPYHIASVTKLFIAASILKLHERREVDIESPIAAYLPESFTSGLHVLNGVDRTSEITVRHLLSHTSGLPDWLGDRPKRGRSLFERLATLEDRFISVEEAVAFTRKELTPLFAPQSLAGGRRKVVYSDTNFQLLIAIVEARMQMPLHEAFAELIYRPLGLQHTFHPGRVPKAQAPEPATIWAGESPFTHALLLQSFRDVYSTAEDQLTLMRGIVTGDLFDRPETAMLMQSSWNRFGLPTGIASLARPGWPIEYGLGMMRFQLPRIFSPFRQVPAVVGHTGATGSWLFYCPRFDLYLCGTVDQVTAATVPFRVVPRILSLVRSSLG